MKKLIVLPIGLLIASNIFGQTSGVFRIVDDKYPQHIIITNSFKDVESIDAITDYANGKPIKLYSMFSNRTYHFIEKNKIYMISYDTIRTTLVDCGLHGGIREMHDDIERDVHLFRWNGDGTWSIVTDKPIQTDYFIRKGDTWILENYYPMHYANIADTKPEYGAKVEKLNNGEIKITLVCSKNVNFAAHSDFYQKIIILRPNGNGTYHPTWDGIKIPVN